MTPGLPGTGIGGMFYLLSALAMPLRHAYLRARGRAGSAGWRVVMGQASIAGGILAGMWFAGWLIGMVVRVPEPLASTGGGPHSGNVLQIAMFAIASGTLALVLLGVEVLRLVTRRRRVGR